MVGLVDEEGVEEVAGVAELDAVEAEAVGDVVGCKEVVAVC